MVNVISGPLFLKHAVKKSNSKNFRKRRSWDLNLQHQQNDPHASQQTQHHRLLFAVVLLTHNIRSSHPLILFIKVLSKSSLPHLTCRIKAIWRENQKQNILLCQLQHITSLARLDFGPDFFHPNMSKHSRWPWHPKIGNPTNLTKQWATPLAMESALAIPIPWEHPHACHVPIRRFK